MGAFDHIDELLHNTLLANAGQREISFAWSRFLYIPNTSISALVIKLVWVHAILACLNHACEFMSQVIPAPLALELTV